MADIFNELFKHFKLDEIDIDNWNFKLYSKVTVGIFMLVSAASVATTYSGGAIECRSADFKEYSELFCWTHGSYHLPNALLEKQINRGERCFSPSRDQTSDEWNDDSEEDYEKSDTEYYLWVSLMLFVHGALFMLPNQLWKYFEGGMMKQFKLEGTMKQSVEEAKDHAKRFDELSKKMTRKYFFTFLVCEYLNVIIAIVNYLIINSFLSGKFMSYGSDVLSYYIGTPYPEEILGKSVETINPMCNAFPTVVSCKTSFAGVSGIADKRNEICILGQNIINQKIYIILWWWFIILFISSALMTISRVVTIAVPNSRRAIIEARMMTTKRVHVPAFPFSDIGHWFVLGQIGRNSNPYYFRELMRHLVTLKKSSKNDIESANENEPFIPYNERNDKDGIELPQINKA